MDFKNKVELIKRLDYYIRNKNKGRPTVIAKRLGVSERNLFRLVETIEQMGGQLEYSAKIESYYYKKSGRLFIGFEEDTLESLN